MRPTRLRPPPTVHILMNALSSVSGGATTYLKNILPLLIERFDQSNGRYKLTVLAHESQKDELPSLPQDSFIWVGGRRPVGLRRLIWEQREISPICSQRGIDILFTPYQTGPAINSVRHVMMIRNMEPFLHHDYKYSFPNRLRSIAVAQASSASLQRADRVIAVSQFARDYLEEVIKVPRSRTRMIYHGRTDIPPVAHGAQPGVETRVDFERPFVLTCGSLLPYRRCEDVIASFDRIADRLPPGTQLVIAGTGTDKAYAALIHAAIATARHRERIVVAGHVSFDLMVEFYRRCLVCIIATEIEACPNIAIEALNAGCVIVAANKKPLPEILRDAAVFYPPRSLDELAATLLTAVTDDLLRRQLLERARNRAGDFSWEKCANATVDALTKWD